MAELDIPDPSDWLPTQLPTYAPLETALRCQICKDFYHTPVITSCSHTFCSLCIRRSLSDDGKCPICRVDEQASKLRRNLVIEEVVARFEEARPKALDLAAVPIEADDDNSSSKPRKRRKLDDAPPGPAPTANARQTRSSRKRQNLSQSNSVDEEIPNGSAEPETQDNNDDDGLVACPICSTRMKEDFVFGHLSHCDGVHRAPDPSQRAAAVPAPVSASASASASTDRKTPLHLSAPKPSTSHQRLPGLQFDLLTDRALRKKFDDQGIPSWGTRDLLKRRYTEWLNLWNAECDSDKPRGKRVLLRELDTWERTLGGLARNSAGGGGAGVGVGVVGAKKEFDHKAYQVAHKTDFDRLIQEARRKVKSPAVPAEKAVEALDLTEESTVSRSDHGQHEERQHEQHDAVRAPDAESASAPQHDVAGLALPHHCDPPPSSQPILDAQAGG